MTENQVVLPLENCLKNFHSAGFGKQFLQTEQKAQNKLERKAFKAQRMICLKKWHVQFIHKGIIKQAYLYGLINKSGEKGWILTENNDLENW